MFFFFKQKTAYEMRISDWSSDVCSSDLVRKDRNLASKAESAVKRPSKAEQRAEMMEQILDTAELLFSKHGFHGVTLKDVAKQVGVHHTLLNYYFDDKQTPFDAVFAWRAVVTIDKRMQALNDYRRAAGGQPTDEGAPPAFLAPDPALYTQGGEGKNGRT